MYDIYGTRAAALKVASELINNWQPKVISNGAYKASWTTKESYIVTVYLNGAWFLDYGAYTLLCGLPEKDRIVICAPTKWIHDVCIAGEPVTRVTAKRVKEVRDELDLTALLYTAGKKETTYG